jgi:rRNA-processing protein FCF1
MYLHLKQLEGGMQPRYKIPLPQFTSYNPLKSSEHGISEEYLMYEFPTDGDAPPVFYRRLTDVDPNPENINPENIYDALHIEALDEAYRQRDEYGYENTQTEMVRFYKNILDRLKIYNHRGMPIYLTRSDDEDEDWEDFVQFCKDNQLSEIVTIVTSGKSHVRRIKPHLGNIRINLREAGHHKTIEIGGHYGCACVWSVARSADNVVTSNKPDALMHPNIPVFGFSHQYDIERAFINPNITQGHNCLSDEYCEKIPFVEFPKYSQDAIDRYLRIHIAKIINDNDEKLTAMTTANKKINYVEQNQIDSMTYFNTTINNRGVDNITTDLDILSEIPIDWTNDAFQVYNQ